jgi:hypothetical protein
MAYVKGILSGLVAIIIAELVPGSWSVLRGMSGSKATGLAAVAGGLVRKYSFATILDSSPCVFRVVLCGQPARKQAPENILVLDSDAHGFLIQSRDCGFVHLPDCACRTSLRPGNSGQSGAEAIYRHLPGFGQHLRRMGQ